MPNLKKTPAVREKKASVKKPEKQRRFRPLKFIREVIAELKKVTWPTRKELISYTLTVLGFVLIAAIIIGLMDLGLTELMNLIVGI